MRALEAVGNSCFLTSSFSIVAEIFPDKTGSMFAILEAFFGLGLIIGPTVGSALYQFGGYLAPFAILGTFLVIIAGSTICILPKLESNTTRSSKGVTDAMKVS